VISGQRPCLSSKRRGKPATHPADLQLADFTADARAFQATNFSSQFFYSHNREDQALQNAFEARKDLINMRDSQERLPLLLT
jgi:hypothetical protein